MRGRILPFSYLQAVAVNTVLALLRSLWYSKQSLWDRLDILCDLTTAESSLVTCEQQASFRAAAAPHCGDWLYVLAMLCRKGVCIQSTGVPVTKEPVGIIIYIFAWPARSWLLSTCRDIWEGGDRTTATATFVYSLLLRDRRCFSNGRTVKWCSGDITHSLSRYRYSQDGAVWHVQPTLHMNPVRGHCNGTQYVVRQVTSVHRGRNRLQPATCCSSCGYHCRLRLYS